MAPSCYYLPPPCHCQFFYCAAIYVRILKTSQVMFELSQSRPVISQQARFSAQNQQSRKLLIALVLLLVALVAVLIKDRQFWFGTEQATIESDMPETQPAPQAAAQPVAPAPAVAVPAKRPTVLAKAAAQPKAAEEEAPIVRTPVAPLDVEVVAGDSHRGTRQPANIAKADSAPAVSAPAIQEITNAAERDTVTNVAAIQTPTGAFKAYPVLAQHMNVQGSVVLQALISAEGTIENIRVLSGPAILTSAAEQAVREWRFRPIYQNGQAVESKAKITVNFSIKVADSAPTNTVAQGRPSGNPLLNR